MTCKTCNGHGYIVETVQFFFDGGWFPEFITSPCECNQPATDADYLAFLRYDAAIDQQIKNDQSGYDPRDWDDAALPSHLLA
jgi:hypothetical protein